jgi:NMD protein affecting ribosome stability and mRNA decay
MQEEFIQWICLTCGVKNTDMPRETALPMCENCGAVQDWPDDIEVGDDRVEQLLQDIESTVRVLRQNYRQAVLSDDPSMINAFGGDIDDLWNFIYGGG